VKDIKTRVYELTGKAGTICGMSSSEAMTRYITANYKELSDLEYNIIDMDSESRSEILSVVNWSGYIAEAPDWEEKQRRRKQYMRSPAWKRKRDMVIACAMQHMPIPENPIIHGSYDRYGRLIQSIEVDWKPICQREFCTNIATQVHHLHYYTLGREDIQKDLQAICGKCHNAISN